MKGEHLLDLGSSSTKDLQDGPDGRVDGWTDDEMIHDSPYNTLQNWNYASMVETLKGSILHPQQTVRTEKELMEAL